MALAIPLIAEGGPEFTSTSGPKFMDTAKPAASLARRLMFPVSRDTLLRVLRRRAPAVAGSVRVIGIDDFEWKRSER